MFNWAAPGDFRSPSCGQPRLTTVDVTTVAKLKKDLKGWYLSRCMSVGDAGNRRSMSAAPRSSHNQLLAANPAWVAKTRHDRSPQFVRGERWRYAAPRLRDDLPGQLWRLT